MLELLDETTQRRLRECPLAIKALRLARQALPRAVCAKTIASALGLSPTALSRLFAARVGRRFKAVVQVLRVELALDVLGRTDCALDHLAEISGYGSARTFSRSFKAIVGVTPSEFRRRLVSIERNGGS